MIKMEVEMASEVLAAEEVHNMVGAIISKSIFCHDLPKENNSNKVVLVQESVVEQLQQINFNMFCYLKNLCVMF